MIDYRQHIRSILTGRYSEHCAVEALNAMLNDLGSAGFDNLVKNFCDQRDLDRAYDILFEVWLCQLLRHNSEVRNLQYEPPDVVNPPDFRFVIEDVNFEVEAKRIHNIENEITERTFRRECEKHLPRIPKPWLINFWVSKDFKRKHINQFFAYVKKNIANFTSDSTLSTQYKWSPEGETLVKFSFVGKNSQEPGIRIGVIEVGGKESGLLSSMNQQSLRNAVERKLKDAKVKLTKRVSPRQCNLVVIQGDSSVFLWVDEDSIGDLLYGRVCQLETLMPNGTINSQTTRAPNGLLHSNKFSTICGLILVPNDVLLLEDHFRGTYFHLYHWKSIVHHPKPFIGMKSFIPYRGLPKDLEEYLSK